MATLAAFLCLTVLLILAGFAFYCRRVMNTPVLADLKRGSPAYAHIGPAGRFRTSITRPTPLPAGPIAGSTPSAVRGCLITHTPLPLLARREDAVTPMRE